MRRRGGGGLGAGALVAVGVVVVVGAGVIYALAGRTKAPEKRERTGDAPMVRAVPPGPPGPLGPLGPPEEYLRPAAAPKAAPEGAASDEPVRVALVEERAMPEEPEAELAEADHVEVEEVAEAAVDTEEAAEPRGLGGVAAPSERAPAAKAPVEDLPPPPVDRGKEWKLVWSDEFDYEGLPDPKKWDYEVGWIRNGELQYYTRNRLENARAEKGVLVIEGRKERYAVPAGDPQWSKHGRSQADYTAASITTSGRSAWTYGRIEVRAKMPKGRGTWPAIWMLGTNIKEVGWPKCGEIDIMEYVGYDPDGLYATVHTGAYNHMRGTQRGGRTSLPSPWEAFHVYAVEWSEMSMTFFIDERKVFSFANEGTGDDVWPFHRPHYLIINLAMGGGWGGAKGVDDSIWPQKYYIDYARVYERTGYAYREPEKRAGRRAKGLAWAYYEGKWKALPDFSKLRPAAKGEAGSVGLDVARRRDEYALVFEGFVEVPRDGLYLFFTESDDGSRLLIGDDVVVSNDGPHGMRALGGEIALKKGLHPIRVEYFEMAGGEGLEVAWQGPGFPRQPIPASVLSHR